MEVQNQIEKNILVLIDTIYGIDDDKKSEILGIVQALDEENKKTVLIALYQRYQAMVESSKLLLQKVKVVNNYVQETFEKLNVDNISFSI